MDADSGKPKRKKRASRSKSRKPKPWTWAWEQAIWEQRQKEQALGKDSATARSSSEQMALTAGNVADLLGSATAGVSGAAVEIASSPSASSSDDHTRWPEYDFQ